MSGRPTNEFGSLVGWMGITVSVPEGWSPVSLSGEGESGYLKIVSPDSRQLELKWERPRGAVSVPDALEAYLERLRRAARKQRQELRVRRKPKGMSGVRPPAQAPISYAWEADRKALGCIWHCGECGRLVIAELVGDHGDDLSLAPDLVRAVRDHGEEVEGAAEVRRPARIERWNTWGLYGLTVPAPASYRMERHTLVTGHQRFELRSGGSTIVAERWALAEMALRGTTLREWYASRPGCFLGAFDCRFEDAELNGHSALRISGRLHAFHGLTKHAPSALSLRWPSFFLHGYLWQCPESNRIYAVLGEQPRRSTLIDRIVERMRCHSKDAG